MKVFIDENGFLRSPYIIDNRSQLWYNHITEEQKAELNSWYEAWLDAPKTKIIPAKPKWL